MRVIGKNAAILGEQFARTLSHFINPENRGAILDLRNDIRAMFSVSTERIAFDDAFRATMDHLEPR